MRQYLEKNYNLPLEISRRKQFNDDCSRSEPTAFLGLAGSLNFLDHGALKKAAFAARYLQQSVGRLQVSDLIKANNVVGEIKSLEPNLHYPSTYLGEDHPLYLSFSDASQSSSAYGQTGTISGIFLPARGEKQVYHVLGCVSNKQGRVLFHQ